MASKFQTKIINQFKKDGWTVLNVMKLSDSGYPDILCMKFGEVDRWIDCKEANDTLKELQMYRIDELNRLGKNAYCIQDTKGIIYP